MVENDSEQTHCKRHKEMQDLYGGEEAVSTAAIGFQMPESDEEYYETEE